MALTTKPLHSCVSSLTFPNKVSTGGTFLFVFVGINSGALLKKLQDNFHWNNGFTNCLLKFRIADVFANNVKKYSESQYFISSSQYFILNFCFCRGKSWDTFELEYYVIIALHHAQTK